MLMLDHLVDKDGPLHLLSICPALEGEASMGALKPLLYSALILIQCFIGRADVQFCCQKYLRLGPSFLMRSFLYSFSLTKFTSGTDRSPHCTPLFSILLTSDQRKKYTSRQPPTDTARQHHLRMRGTYTNTQPFKFQTPPPKKNR